MIVADDLTTLVGTAAAIGHVTIAGAVTVHVLLYKRNVGAAVSWIGIAWLSPFLGGLLYAIMGVNRVKRRAKRLRRERLPLAIADPDAAAAATDPLTPLEYAVGRLTGLPAEPGNAVEILRSGDESYPRMLQEIERAQKSIGLCSYIFRADAAGEKFHDALIHAQRRGVCKSGSWSTVSAAATSGQAPTSICARRACRSPASSIRIFLGGCRS